MIYALWLFGVTFCLGVATCDDECWPWLESAAVVAVIGGIFAVLTEYIKIRMTEARNKEADASL